MPKKNTVNENIPLPPGWQMCQDFDGKVFFIDHNRQETSWIDPRDRVTKPADFSECTGNELPYGWEEVFDPHIGVFYTNHKSKKNQLEDPRQEHLRVEQECMLKDYLVHAQQHITNKKEICSVKQERLAIAREEVQHLNHTLKHWKSSRTSLQSVASTTSKYDPELLRGEVDLARKRVTRLKHEIASIQAQMSCKERGLETLSQVEQKLMTGDNPESAVYSREDAHDIITQIRHNYHSLSRAEEERRRLLAELAGMREELCGHRADSSPHLSTSSLSRDALSTASAASQTDLSGESEGLRWGEVARMRLQYNEAAQHVSALQQQLADVEDQISPSQNESDKDMLLLINEKEQLLRELRSVNGRPQGEMAGVQARIQQLQNDLQEAVHKQNRQIAERIKLNDSKAEVLRKLEEATKLTSFLETQLKSLSVSTLSMSSGSSRGSLGSLASSKGSLSSLNFSDIYSTPALPDVDLPDLHRRVEKLLQGVNAEDAGSNQYLATIAENPNVVGSAVSPRSSHSSLASGASPYGSGNSPYVTGNIPYETGHTQYPVENAQFENEAGGYGAAPPPSYQQHIDKQRVGSNSQPNVHASSGGPPAYPTSSSHPNLAMAPPPTLAVNPAVLAMTEEYACAAGAALQTEYAAPTQEYMHVAGVAPKQHHHMEQTYGSQVPVHGANQSPLKILADNILEGQVGPELIPAERTNVAAQVSEQRTEQLSAAHAPPPYPGPVSREAGSQAAQAQLAPLSLPQSQSNPNLSSHSPRPAVPVADHTHNNLSLPVTQRPPAPLSLPPESSPAQAAGKVTRPRSAMSDNSGHSGGVIRRSSENSSRSGAVVRSASESGSRSGGVVRPAVSENSSRSGARSVSAARSDESVAGDSGVFESAKKPTELEKLYEMSLESAQVQLRLRYEDKSLVVAIEQARNLAALHLPPHCHVCIKAALLPSQQGAGFQTSASHNVSNPVFRETCRFAVPETRLASKTLQVHVFSIAHSGAHELLGSAQVSLASFDSQSPSVTAWYNVLSLRFMAEPTVQEDPPAREEKSAAEPSVKPAGGLEGAFFKPTPSNPSPAALKEESSDESTIISSQTSTLTRNLGPDAMAAHAGVGAEFPSYGGALEFEASSDEEDEAQFEFGDGEDSDANFSPEGTVRFVSRDDKQTNTDMSHVRPHVTRRPTAQRGPIRRSQTFTPSAFRQNADSLRNTQLNRSDSDSSVRHRKDPFTRNAIERRSVRHRRSMLALPKAGGSGGGLALVPQPKKPPRQRTSIDLELDLQASEARLSQMDEDLQRLKQLKHRFQAAKTHGPEPPKWLTENEALQNFLAQADAMKAEAGGAEVKSASEQRADHLLRKAKREAHKLRKSQHASQQQHFREKMVQITNMATHVPLLPVDSDSDDDVTHSQSHVRVKHKTKAAKQKALAGDSAGNKTESKSDKTVKPSDSFKEKQTESGDKT